MVRREDAADMDDCGEGGATGGGSGGGGSSCRTPSDHLAPSHCSVVVDTTPTAIPPTHGQGSTAGCIVRAPHLGQFGAILADFIAGTPPSVSSEVPTMLPGAGAAAALLCCCCTETRW